METESVMSKVLPPILFLALATSMLLMQFIPVDTFKAIHKSGVPNWEVAISAILGLLLLIGARLQFNKNDSEINTFKSPRNLVTTGFFRFTRNPMYLGFFLILLSFALYVNIWQALLGPLAFFIAAHYWYIPIEEEAAREQFGEAYHNYCKNVRRWL